MGGKNLPMEPLERKIAAQLEALPVPVALVLPGGRRLGAVQPAVTLTLADWSSMAVLAAGQIGRLAEDIVEGRVEVQGTMRALMAAAAHLLPGSPVGSDTGWWTQIVRHAKSLAAHSSPQKDAAQVQFHYDLSDDFYALWLGTRAASIPAPISARRRWTWRPRKKAKLDHICRKLRLAPGERFVDIGAGWGGLLLWAAEHYGVQATGITLSHHQHAYVQQRIDELGLAGRVRIELCDYREFTPHEALSQAGVGRHARACRAGATCGAIARRCTPWWNLAAWCSTTGSRRRRWDTAPARRGAGRLHRGDTSSPAASCCM